MKTYTVDFGDLMSATLLFEKVGRNRLGRFLGAYGIPPRGGYDWWAANNTEGHVDDESAAQACIRAVAEGMRS